MPRQRRVEPEELQARAAEREVLEETGFAVRAAEKVGECDTHDGRPLIHWRRAEPIRDAPVRLANDEHSELASSSAAARAATRRGSPMASNAPWPVNSGSADVVTPMLVLEHLEQLAPVFARAARVLSPAGALCELHPARQRLGAGARVTAPGAAAPEPVRADPHDVSDYVNAALEAGFALQRLDEHRDAGAPFESPPRLLPGLRRAPPPSS